ncbi:uncharacterized protein LOC123194760 [Mangifera indica]|uniref:uncharacterized protein LOC123194760 n=1 Tax=Mangifera indica TaxID=29780 RepID=UPI001CFC3C4B|nr:uncharacterized protein LOC123194760 [Mangifera indica]
MFVCCPFLSQMERQNVGILCWFVHDRHLTRLFVFAAIYGAVECVSTALFSPILMVLRIWLVSPVPESLLYHCWSISDCITGFLNFEVHKFHSIYLQLSALYH